MSLHADEDIYIFFIAEQNSPLASKTDIISNVMLTIITVIWNTEILYLAGKGSSFLFSYGTRSKSEEKNMMIVFASFF